MHDKSNSKVVLLVFVIMDIFYINLFLYFSLDLLRLLSESHTKNAGCSRTKLMMLYCYITITPHNVCQYAHMNCLFIFIHYHWKQACSY